MAKSIGECRLNAYQLFFEKPLCKYSLQEQKVLIAGNGNQAKETFKISLMAGQFINKELLVEFYSNNAKELENELLNENGKYPALNKFINTKNSRVLFKDDDISSVKFENYNYIILAFDDIDYNLEIASEILKTSSFKEDTLVAVVAESDDKLSAKVENAETYIWGNQTFSDFKKTELMCLAKNVNFSYAMDYKQNTSCENADLEFIKNFDKEFCAPENNFYGANYEADSSIASAVHIPYKLELCKQLGKDDDSVKILCESVASKNNIYKNLVELEHMRWNVYMALRGFRAPTIDECHEYLYTENNDHKNKEKLLHMCMVDFDKLDKISKLSAELASAKSKNIIADKEEIFSKLPCIKQEEQNLKRAIEKLFNNDANSVRLYDDALKNAEGNISEDTKNYLETKLIPVKTRNRAIDFKGIDEQLIDFLPFCLWYRKKYKRVLTISDGIALNDVIIPTIFCATDLLFLGSKLESNFDYSKSLTRYFTSRFGENSINAKFQNIDEYNLIDILTKEIEKVGNDEILINISLKQNVSVIVALGKFVAEHPEIAVVSYDKKINVVNGDKNISAGVDNKYFTAEEVIRLTGGEPTNEYNRVLSWGQRDIIGGFFNKYYTFNSYKTINSKGKEKTSYFNTWILMNDIFKSAMGSKKLNINGEYQKDNCKNTQYGELEFERSFYKESGIEEVLKKCNEKNIIRNFQTVENGKDINVSFEYVEAEQELFKTFEKFSKKESSNDTKRKYNRIAFNNDGINTYSLHIYKPINNSGNIVRLYTDDEHRAVKESKEQFMLELEECGLIENLSKQNLQDLNFIVKGGEFIRWILMTQGAVFEEILLHQLYQYGQFDDLKLGVNFSWNQEIRNFDRNVQNKIDALSCDEFGYQVFQKCVDDVKSDNKKNMFDGIENEIDIIAVKKMNSYFISCKTNKKHENNWLYEIKSISNHFNATPIMATAHLYKELERCEFVNRSYQMNISLIGMETIYNKNKLEIALGDVLDGKIISPSINERGKYVYEL